MGKAIPTAPLSSYPGALKISNILKEWISEGRFTLGIPQLAVPTVPYRKISDEI